MSNRLDRETQNHLVQRIGYMREALDGIRTDQTFGSSNVRSYLLTGTSGTPDITITSLTASTPRCVEVTVTPTGDAINPVIVYDWTQSMQMPSGNVGIIAFPLAPVSGVQKFRFYYLSSDITKTVTVTYFFWSISDATYPCQEVTP